MDPHTLEIIDFARVQQLLAEHASCALGRQMALRAKPAVRIDLIEQWLEQVHEMIDVAARYNLPPYAGVHDLREVVQKAAPPQIPEPEVFAALAETFDATHAITHWAGQLPTHVTQLRKLCEEIGDFKGLADAIHKVIGPTGEVRDDASAKLLKLRTEIEQARTSVGHVVDKLLRNPHVTRWLRYAEATFHEDRLVLPLSAEHRGRVRGIVHRTSDSGATLFVEPAEAVELNNRIIDLRAQEEAEINRLLWHLTHQVQLNQAEILKTLDRLAILDLITAKVRFARSYDLTCPTISREGKLRLIRARHPLLVQIQKQARQEGEDRPVVPIDLRLGDDFDVLIVTGPNTGGKTVTLKTAALCCAMAQAGIPIPAAAGSFVPIFQDILVDIGDEQSLQQSLSTFSSHLKRLLLILQQAKADTLVLIDELGAGTDPDEGAALGQAIVRELLERKCPALVTTHLGTLKSLAFTEARAENGCVDFDEKTLRPTYRLLIGEPGNSNAINIAAKLGLPGKIIQSARGLLDSSHQQLTRAIRGTLQSRRMAEQARANAEAARLQAEQQHQAAAAKLADLQEQELHFQKWVQTISTLKPGDPVHVKRFDRPGRIVRVQLHKQMAVVNMGAMEAEVPLRELSFAEPRS